MPKYAGAIETDEGATRIEGELDFTGTPAPVDPSLAHFTGPNAAPADATLAAGGFSLWLDATDGAGKLMVKAKTANGTVVAGSVTLT